MRYNTTNKFSHLLFPKGGRQTRNSYQVLGLGLIIIGAIFAPIAYFLSSSIPLTAIGVSAILVGFVSLVLARSRSGISPEASEIMFQAGTENIAAILEEFAVKDKAIYLPSAMSGGRSQAVIPLQNKVDPERIIGKTSRRLIVHHGDKADELAIAVTTPGNIRLEGLDIKAGGTTTEIEVAMIHALVGFLDLANSVTVNMNGKHLDVVVHGARLHYEESVYYRCLGSPIASIVASIACESLGKPVRITEESYQKGRGHILLEVIP